jgi:ParB family chromosome partitioning protein
METINLSNIRFADYNPRKISEESYEQLKTSLKTLGVIKPILVNRANNVLIAGHQRTKAMREIGIEECICYYLSNVSNNDERRFNQFHNRCEYEISKDAPVIKITKKLQLGYNKVKAEELDLVDKGKNGSLNFILCELMNKYGAFGMPISDIKGNIIISSAYALAALNTETEMEVLVLPDEKIELAKYYLSRDYGEFDYEGLERNTYMQSLAQMNRLRHGKGKMLHSRLYEELIIPYIQDKKMLEFWTLEQGIMTMHIIWQCKDIT